MLSHDVHDSEDRGIDEIEEDSALWRENEVEGRVGAKTSSPLCERG